MIDLGHFSLVAAWVLSLYGLIGGIVGGVRKNSQLQRSAMNSVYVVACLCVISLLVLAGHFLQHEYRYAYVWRNSNNAMPPHYLVSAIWGGMDGSMLLWAGMLSIYAAVALSRTGEKAQHLAPWASVVFSGVTNFFLFVVTFLTNPFRFIPTGAIPPDGNGLNPLLQNPSMLIHPVTLYLGFTGLTVPFAFCFAALLSGHLGSDWIRLTRRWTLVGWGFLTAGILLGGNWAYIELGWGGFWAWDPVENASFLPWLTATAYLHSVMVQERKGMLKVWNVFLCALTYILTVFGTFLTRSGIVQSVHAFAETDVGWVFLVFIGMLIVFSVLVVAYRWSELKPESQFESYLSREAAFLFNNLALLAICFATLWGVLFPVISEAVTGTKSVVGPPFFNQVNVPLFLILIFLMGVGPLIAWRKTSKKALIRMFAKPFIVGSVITVLFLTIDPERIGAAVSFGLCTFVLGTIIGEFHRAARVQKEFTGGSTAKALVRVVKRKPVRYGAYIVHLGVVVATVSITASMVYKVERDFSLLVGERFQIRSYALELAELQEENVGNYSALKAVVRVYDKNSNEFITELRPEQRFYPASGQSTTEVDIRMTLLEDLYIALGGLDSTVAEGTPLAEARAVFKVFVNPLQFWLWVGSLIVFVGTIIVIGPNLRETAPVVLAETDKSTQEA